MTLPGQAPAARAVRMQRTRLRQRELVALLRDRPPIELVGVTVVEAQPFRLRFEVDPGQQPIEQLIARMMSAYRVADLTVEEPPLEKVIAAIYAATGRPTGRR